MKEKITFRESAALHLRAVRTLHKVSPHYFPLLTVYCILKAIQPYVTVFFSARILTELSLYRREDVLWTWVAAGVLCTGVLGIATAFLSRRTQTLLNDLWGRKEILFVRKMFAMDYALLDRQETHDLRAQIKQNENWAGWGLMDTPETFEKTLTGVISILSGVALTVSLFLAPVADASLSVLNHPIFAPLLLLFMLTLSFLGGQLRAKATSYWSSTSDDALLSNRQFGFFSHLGNDKERSVDIRMNEQEIISEPYWRNNTVFGAKGSMARHARGKVGVFAGLSTCVTVLITGAVYVFTCFKAWGGAFDVGSITQYVGAATAMTEGFYETVSLFGRMKTNAPYLRRTFEFLDMPNAMYQGSLTTEKRSDRQYEVEFRDVSFRYEGSERWALRHVNLKFKVGSRLAIVGENGSGKTTFIKLLCRLYDPQEGQILLNGIDIRKYRYDDYMDIFSVVFQDFKLLSQPLGSVVAGAVDYDETAVRRALTDAGFDERLQTLPEGLQTQLYSAFSENGVELSGGEAQKVAIARALYKNAPFIILDEPTAALDPIAEAEIYAKFDEITGDKTAIYISHRLSSCKFCDEIAVFHDGGLVQKGTHAALLADECGKYHALWHAQAQYYTDRDS